MDKEFPLYPELREEAKAEAQALMDEFKKKMLEICKDVLTLLYCDVAMYIESDSWSNFRNELLRGFSTYGNRKLQADYDFAKIRQTIFEEHREEIIKEVKEDIVKENESLKKQLECERSFNRNRY